MTKQQTIGSACGGAFAVCVCALGYFLYDAASARAEAEEQLASEEAAFSSFNNAAVFPSKKSIADVKTNEIAFAEWRKAALSLASRGDRKPAAPEEPSVFKQRLQAEVRRLSSLPGGVGGKICAPDFLFGFDRYLGESGVLPQNDEVPRLAEQLDAISKVAEFCSEAGAVEIKTVQRVDPKNEDDDASSRKSSSAKNGRKGGAKQSSAPEGPKIEVLDYRFEISVRPAAFVKILNAFLFSPRFFVVKDFSFKQTEDDIVNRITAAESAKQQAAAGATEAASSSRRRRRRSSAAPEPETPAGDANKSASRIVADPETDSPILMSFTLSVYDFGSGAAESASAGKEEEK